MAISVDWLTKVVFVPRADMPVTQASPERRELDIDAFRLELKSLEASEGGLPFPDIHRHVAPITLAGITYARTVEIINGYTVEFEDGVYGVLAKGANSNVFDVKVDNQVSFLANNSAGLIDAATVFDQIKEIWQLNGLDQANPLVITQDSPTQQTSAVGDITLTGVESPAGTVTATRS